MPRRSCQEIGGGQVSLGIFSHHCYGRVHAYLLVAMGTWVVDTTIQGLVAGFTMCHLSYFMDRVPDGDLEPPVILVLNIDMRNGITRARAFLAGSSLVL